MTPAGFASLEGFDSHETRKKRLGQYFSGQPVSRLLVALASHCVVRSVIDPMSGRGDMLTAARGIIATCRRTDGIEIDPLAHSECLASVRAERGFESTCLLGSAFDAATASRLVPEGYDLVATNPPYVRYQSQKAGAGLSAKVPSALEVRNGLRTCLEQLTVLDAEDKAAFLTLAESYSGLSDLAVPSWILCAAMVKPGGTLAMVVPDSWLNRDYASVIRYLLLRWFRIEYIVEDAHAAWFPDAQVKTTLLVARRVPRLASVNAWGDETYLHVTLPSDLANEMSLVGRSAFGTAPQPEHAFAKRARAVLEGKADELVPGAMWQRVRLADQAASIARRAAAESWFAWLEPHAEAQQGGSYALPSILASWFGAFRNFTTLGELGVEIGQGLRTGANNFFYADTTARSRNTATVRLSKLFGCASLDIPSSCLMPVVRKQTDVAGLTTVDVVALPGTVLAFHGWALPEHAAEACAQALPPAVSTHVRCAARTAVAGKAIPDLTAVSPNVRKPNPRTGTPARFWYMLPDFAPRHSPDLFVARVNSETPRVLLNPQRRALVDANFSTLWLRDDSLVTVPAVLAFLNSPIAVALYEYTGAVMGGGALKLEATHLRSLPVPLISDKVWKQLDALGTSLATAPSHIRQAIIQRVNKLLCKEMFGAAGYANKVRDLHLAIQQRQSARIKKP